MKIFGLMDLGVLIVFIGILTNLIPWNNAIGFIIYLFLKAFLYKGDFASRIDFGIGLYFIFCLFGLSSVIMNGIVIIYMSQKVIMSLKMQRHGRDTYNNMFFVKIIKFSQAYSTIPEKIIKFLGRYRVHLYTLSRRTILQVYYILRT